MLQLFKTDDPALGRLQTAWSTQLNRLLSIPQSRGVQLTNVQLATGDNVINHTLGRAPLGYIVTRTQDAGVTIYDTQEDNSRKNLTLQLVSSGTARVDLWVF